MIETEVGLFHRIGGIGCNTGEVWCPVVDKKFQ